MARSFARFPMLTTGPKCSSKWNAGPRLAPSFCVARLERVSKGSRGRSGLALVITRLFFVATAKVAEMGRHARRRHRSRARRGGGYTLRGQADRRAEVASFVEMDRGAGRALGLAALGLFATGPVLGMLAPMGAGRLPASRRGQCSRRWSRRLFAAAPVLGMLAPMRVVVTSSAVRRALSSRDTYTASMPFAPAFR